MLRAAFRAIVRKPSTAALLWLRFCSAISRTQLVACIACAVFCYTELHSISRHGVTSLSEAHLWTVCFDLRLSTQTQRAYRSIAPCTDLLTDYLEHRSENQLSAQSC